MKKYFPKCRERSRPLRFGLALKGQNIPTQGEALRKRTQEMKALKGRDNFRILSK